jgi:hypothetical protein
LASRGYFEYFKELGYLVENVRATMLDFESMEIAEKPLQRH